MSKNDYELTNLRDRPRNDLYQKLVSKGSQEDFSSTSPRPNPFAQILISNQPQDPQVPQQIQVQENLMAIVAAFFLFSYIGVLVRIGLNRWNIYDGQPASLAVFPQLAGCLIIGYLSGDKERIDSRAHTLFLGLFSALCGSITTFSSVVIYSTQQFFNVADYHRDTAHTVTAGFVIHLLGFGMGYVGFMLGRYIYEWIFDTFIKEKFTGKIVIVRVETFDLTTLNMTDKVIIGLAILFTIAIIPIAILADSNRDVIYSLIFAPIGSLIRRWLGLYNSRIPNFSIGTFTVNVVGSAILAYLYLIPGMTDVNKTGCDVIAGLMDGFCGCLTTVSTFVVELINMKGRKDRNVYGFGSLICAQFLQIVLFSVYSPKAYIQYCS